MCHVHWNSTYNITQQYVLVVLCPLRVPYYSDVHFTLSKIAESLFVIVGTILTQDLDFNQNNNCQCRLLVTWVFLKLISEACKFLSVFNEMLLFIYLFLPVLVISFSFEGDIKYLHIPETCVQLISKQ